MVSLPLRVDPGCATKTSPGSPQPQAAAGPASPSDCTIYVDLTGSDQNAGTGPGKAAKLTIAAGLEAVRAAPAGAGAGKALCVGTGTFHLDATVVITAADAHLTIQGDAAGGTWLSGAKYAHSSAPTPPPTLRDRCCCSAPSPSSNSTQT